jgi:hypothetical protein
MQEVIIKIHNRNYILNDAFTEELRFCKAILKIEEKYIYSLIFYKLNRQEVIKF